MEEERESVLYWLASEFRGARRCELPEGRVWESVRGSQAGELCDPQWEFSSGNAEQAGLLSEEGADKASSPVAGGRGWGVRGHRPALPPPRDCATAWGVTGSGCRRCS